MSNAKFETFWTALNQCPYELPVEIKPYLQTALNNSGFSDAPILTGGAVIKAAAAKVKKLSGYNLYMREKMAELKTQNVPAGERMTKVSTMWKALNDDEKANWKTKAGGLVPVVTTTQVKASKAVTGPKKLSGYQFYVRETMPVVKAKAEIAAKERMGEIGKMWKALKDEEKAAYKVKAEQA